MMVPVGRLALLRSVDRSDYVRAMAWLVVPAFVGPVLGPPVGGFITTYISWRWVFFLNVPIGLVGMILVTFLIENTKAPHSPPLDWLGFLLSGVSLAAILYSLDLAAHGSFAESLGFVALLLGGLGLGALAIRHSRRHPHPLLDLALFRLPTYEIGLMGGLFYRVAAGSVPFLLPVFLQVGLGMTAFVAGLLILADAIGNIAMNAVAPAVLRRFGFRQVLIYNGYLSALCIAAGGIFTDATPAWLIFVAYLVCGCMRSLQYNALSTIQYAEISAREMSAATSLAQMFQQLCSGGGIAVGAVALQFALLLRGVGPDALAAIDLREVFFAMAAFALISIAFFRRLAPDAGAELSGHRAPADQNVH
jgi:MFS family permease